jgi:transposase InsO family protein
MSAVITQHLVDLSRSLATAPRNQKTALCQVAAEELGLSLATVYRKMKEITVATTSRKRRTDAGISQLTRQEALTISAAIIESARRNDKRLYSLEDAVEALRASGLINAGRVDTATGEFVPMSISAIRRAMINYRLHPDLLLASAPVTELVSEHPNHVWQIDASLCVLYYLQGSAQPGVNGLQVMHADRFYKNKPRNLASIAADRVWSYEITDHYTGWIYVEYVMRAESSENLTSVLINAMQERGGADILHGVPRILMMDPGSANTSAMTQNLCRSLGIRCIPHAPGAARVTGQVENARNLIERKFEAGLRFHPVANLDELNMLAQKWRSHFNADKVHSRHKKSRTALWMTIRQEQLIKAPAVDVCRALAVSTPVSRKVTSKLRISFEGSEYSVALVPHVMVDEKLMVTRNPWRADSVQVHTTDAEGQEIFYVAPAIAKNEAGFDIDGAVIGEAFKRHAETPAQISRKAASRLAMGVDSEDELKAARKEKRIPFGGELKPYQHIADAKLPDFMPRRGTQHDLVPPKIETAPLNVIQVAKQLRSQFTDWGPDHLAWLNKHHPAGVKEEQLQAVADDLRKSITTRPALTVVGA